jgi:hypothetical protein
VSMLTRQNGERTRELPRPPAGSPQAIVTYIIDYNSGLPPVTATVAPET